MSCTQFLVLIFSEAILDAKSDKQMVSDIKHIGVPPAVLGHSAVPVNSPIVPVLAIRVTIPTKKK